VSQKVRGLGSNVIVVEVDPVRALQARMDGFRVMKIKDAVTLSDIIITVTGNKHILRKEHFIQMKSGVILANSGHFDVEIDVAGLKEISKGERNIRPFLDEFVLDGGKKIFLCAQGRLVNLAAAEGHPSEVMSLSFCGQALAVEYGVKNDLDAKLHTLPKEIDTQIARLQLKALGLEIDDLTEEQKKYLESWNEGT